MPINLIKIGILQGKSNIFCGLKYEFYGSAMIICCLFVNLCYGFYVVFKVVFT